MAENAQNSRPVGIAASHAFICAYLQKRRRKRKAAAEAALPENAAMQGDGSAFAQGDGTIFVTK